LCGFNAGEVDEPSIATKSDKCKTKTKTNMKMGCFGQKKLAGRGNKGFRCDIKERKPKSLQ